MLRNTFFALLLTTLCIQTNAQFNPNIRYRITNQWQTSKSLDVINDNKNYNQVWLAKTQDVTGQFWSITPVAGNQGYYRLSPQYQSQKALDVINDNKYYNQVWLDRIQPVNGQFWKLTPVPGMQDCYKLSPQYQSAKSLDVVNDGTNNKVQLTQTGNYAGQVWKITPLTAPKSAVPNIAPTAPNTVSPNKPPVASVPITPGAVRFKNRQTANQWINIEKGPAVADAVQPGFLSAQWVAIPVQGTKYVRLESVWKKGTYLNVEKGIVECTAIGVNAWSGHWELEAVEDNSTTQKYYRIKNRWKADLKQPAQYLHTENGRLECSNVSLSFRSANWIVETK